MTKYTIIFSLVTEGHIVEVVNKKIVKSECERLKKIASISDNKTYARIEVVNNETGEIREYWNNSDNKINF